MVWFFLKDKSNNTQKPIRGFGRLTGTASHFEILWERLPQKYKELQLLRMTFW